MHCQLSLALSTISTVVLKKLLRKVSFCLWLVLHCETWWHRVHFWALSRNVEDLYKKYIAITQLLKVDNVKKNNNNKIKRKQNIGFLLLHFLPSPENPALQVQVNEPTVLLQYASAEQSCHPKEHSSVSSKKQWGPTLTNDQTVENNALSKTTPKPFTRCYFRVKKGTR